jgi:hypothetical protein
VVGVERNADMHAARWAKLGHLLAALIFGYPAFASTDAFLLVSTPDGQTKFRQGELIPLDLAFTATTSNRFSINMASYDRSGRMRYETFVVNPAGGTADPLAVYFKAFRGFLGGGLTNFQYLSSKPFVMHLQLNEWARFDRPGMYHVSVISHRVTDQGAGGHAPRPVELRSNELVLEISPADPAWQMEELARIRTILGQFPPTGSVRPDDQRTHALKRLRYLGNVDAAQEMARLFRSEDNQTESECMFGLVGSPSRQSGLEEMRRLLAMSDFPVSQTFLSTMSLLSLDPNSSSETLPSEREEDFRRLREELVRDLATKTGSALALSAAAIFTGNSSEITPEVRQKISRQLIDSFQSLPIETRIGWLQSRWDDVKGDQWIPLLRRLASQYTDFPVPNEMHAYQSLEVSAVALTNWYELDPQDARPAVITEIERPKPRFSGETLGLLPDRILPEAEHAIAEHLVEATDYNTEANLAGLLFRYADPDVLPVVLPKIQHSVGTWACAPQKNALAYVLKVDQNAAKALVEHAINARGQTGCWHTVLTDVGSMQQSSMLQEFAIAALSDGDAELATDAARYLGKYGSSAAERELWVHYVDWAQRWKGRDVELRFSLVGPQTHVWDANFGKALADALATGQSWFADPARLQQIGSLGTESIKQQMEGDIVQASQQPLKIQYIGFTPTRFQIAQYQSQSINELENKLTQFPEGTSFVISGPVPKKDTRIVSDLKSWAKERNIGITQLPPIP